MVFLEKKNLQFRYHAQVYLVLHSYMTLFYIPIFTGTPGGNFIVTNSRSFFKCLNGVTTSKIFSNISTVMGKFSLYKKYTCFKLKYNRQNCFILFVTLLCFSYHCQSCFKTFRGNFAIERSSQMRRTTRYCLDVFFPRSIRFRWGSQRASELKFFLLKYYKNCNIIK